MSERALAKVSVGLPVYNGAPHIRDCLDTLARQTYGNFEVLISDNCSSDDTADICREFAARDPRFRYIRQEVNLGLVGNLEFTLAQADGEYFCWRAHDDLSDEHFIAALAAMLDACPQAILAASASKWIDKVENYEKLYTPADTTGSSQFLRIRQQLFDCIGLWFYHLYRREALVREWANLREEIGLGTMHSDILFLIRMVLAGHVITGPGACLYSQRLEPKASPLHSAHLDDFGKCIAIYRAIVREQLGALAMPFWQKTVLRALALRYLDRRVVRLKPYFKRRIRALPARLFPGRGAGPV